MEACSAAGEPGAVGGADNIDEDEPNFNTPPESLDSMLPDIGSDLESAEDYIKKNKEWIAKSAESVRELKSTMEKLIGQTSSRKAELQNRTERIKQMKKEIDEISTEAIEKEEEELKKLIDVERSNKEINGDTELAVPQEQILTEAYREHLGLQINTSTEGGWVEFIFTDIDPQSADSTFSIKLAIDNSHYKCVSCEPRVEKIDDLLEQLNSHHDLQHFMTELRLEFQALVNKEN